MSDKCSPIHLPIQIEASCNNSSNSCGCGPKQTSSCYKEPLCVIEEQTSVQGTYNNECFKRIQTYPSLQIAYLSNVRNQCNSDLSIVLNPICINWCDFLLLFYPNATGVFNISQSNNNSCAVIFNAQTYENTTNKNIKFNLGQLVKQAWSEKCETSIDNIPPNLNLLLNKDTFSVRSILQSASSSTLTLNQAFETLISNNEIVPADSTSSATVRFVVQYKYCFKPLNVCVLVNFVYITKIPCYKNTSICDDWCPKYSKDTHCRSCLDTTDEDASIEKFACEFESQSVSSGIETIESSEQGSFSIAQSKRINVTDEQSRADSSTW